MLANKIHVIKAALSAVSSILNGEIHPISPAAGQADVVVDLWRQGRDRSRFHIHVGAIVRKSQLAWHAKMTELSAESNVQPLLIAPYISVELAKECRRAGINFLDTAGNAYIDTPAMFVSVTGQARPEVLRIPGDKSTLRKASTLRVVFSLLTIDGLVHKPARAIAEAAGVALGPTSEAINDLRGMGYLSGGVREKRLANRDLLLREWAKQYPISLRDKLKPQRCSPAHPDWQSTIKLDKIEAVWSGEMAAALLTDHLVASTGCIYCWGDQRNVLLSQRLRPDPNGPIELLQAFWPRPDTLEAVVAPTLLVYADLMAGNDGRSREVADILEESLKHA